MIRRPSDPDNDERNPAPVDERHELPIASPPRTPDVVEVALFMIPGPAKPGATVVDLRRANRLPLPDLASYLPIDQQPAAAFSDLPLRTDMPSVPDAVTSADVQLSTTGAADARDDAPTSAPLTERLADLAVVARQVTAAIPRLASDLLASHASAFAQVRLKARTHLTNAAAFGRRCIPSGGAPPLSTIAQLLVEYSRSSRSKIARIFPVIALRLLGASPLSVLRRIGQTSSRRWSTEAARLLASARPAAMRMQRKAAQAWSSTAAQVDAWQRAHVRPAVARIPRNQRVHLAAIATASIVLAFAVARFDRTSGTDTARDPAQAEMVQPDESSPRLDALQGRPLAPVARLARRVAAARPLVAPLPAAVDTDDVPVARRAIVERPRRSVTQQESKAAAVAAMTPATGLPTLVAERPLAPPVDDAVPARTSTLDAPTADGRRAEPTPAAMRTGGAERASAAPLPGEAEGIVEALRHLQRAYERRDAELAKAVWPTVNERALARAFDGLRSQSVAFDQCHVSVRGAAGEAECRGTTTYVPRVGSRYERTESRQWMFRLQKGNESWVITSAAAR